MLLLHDENTHGWHVLMQELLAEPADDRPNDAEDSAAGCEVTKLFGDALAWAVETNYFPAPKHKLKKYVEQYFRTRDRRRMGPIIPGFVCVYCAKKLGRRYSDQPLPRRSHRRLSRAARSGRGAAKKKQEYEARPRLARAFSGPDLPAS